MCPRHREVWGRSTAKILGKHLPFPPAALGITHNALVRTTSSLFPSHCGGTSAITHHFSGSSMRFTTTSSHFPSGALLSHNYVSARDVPVLHWKNYNLLFTHLVLSKTNH